MNKKLFDALKPGGLLIVADHSAKPGEGTAVGRTNHRIEESVLRREVEAAGFKLVEEGNFLRHPEDPRDFNVNRPTGADRRIRAEIPEADVQRSAVTGKRRPPCAVAPPAPIATNLQRSAPILSLRKAGIPISGLHPPSGDELRIWVRRGLGSQGWRPACRRDARIGAPSSHSSSGAARKSGAVTAPRGRRAGAEKRQAPIRDRTGGTQLADRRGERAFPVSRAPPGGARNAPQGWRANVGARV